MRILHFFRSPIGNIVLFCAFVGLGGLLVLRGNARERTQTTKQMTRVDTATPRPTRESISRNSMPFRPIPVAMIKKTGAEEPKVDAPATTGERGLRRTQVA